MKYIFFILIFLSVVTSQATVVDSFSCKLMLKDLTTGQKTTQKLDFDIARRPTIYRSLPELEVTSGSTIFKVEIENAKNNIYVEFNLNYQHAQRELNGILEARQKLCLSDGSSYCPKNGNTASCIAIKKACFELLPPKPFDPNHGWTPVPIVGNVPLFDERLLISADEYIYTNVNQPRKVGHYQFLCEHRGTSDN